MYGLEGLHWVTSLPYIEQGFKSELDLIQDKLGSIDDITGFLAEKGIVLTSTDEQIDSRKQKKVSLDHNGITLRDGRLIAKYKLTDKEKLDLYLMFYNSTIPVSTGPQSDLCGTITVLANFEQGYKQETELISTLREYLQKRSIKMPELPSTEDKPKTRSGWGCCVEDN